MDFDTSAELIVKLAQEVASMASRVDSTWSHAYWRFESEDQRYGSNASYESPQGVNLIGAIAQKASYESLNQLGRRLWEAEPDPGKRFVVCLLSISSSLKYEVKFERKDIAKWRITKLNGATGRPVGL